MRIQKMTLTNFMKIRNLTIDFNGNNALISGPNGVGKTTVFNAFNWLISGKDSYNKSESNFGIKTKVNDVVQHNLTHAVEATVTNGATETTLRREYKEVWKTKRGSTTKTFSGHTTDYFVDDVPMKEKDYNVLVEKLIGCNFQMYSNPMYFSDQLSEKERRTMLIDAFGDVSDADVIAKDESLKPLAVLLESKTIDQVRDMAKSKMKKANDSLKEIPARIDELNRSMESAENPTETLAELQDHNKAIEAEKADHLTNIAKIKAEAGKSSVDDAIAAKRREIAGLKSTYEIDKRETLADADEKIRIATRDLNNEVYEQTNVENSIKEVMAVIKATELELTDLRKQFKAKRDEKHQEPDVMTVCPTCGQDIPAEKVEVAKAEAVANLNQQQAEKLEQLNATGKAFNVTLEDKKKLLEELKAKLQACSNGVKNTMFICENAKKAKADLTFTETWTTQQTELDSLLKQRTGETAVDLSALCDADNQAIKAIDEQISTNATKIAAIRQNDANKKRIDELVAQEEAAQKSYEDNEILLRQCESFTSAKMSMLGDKINGQFELATFRLFTEQINGAIKECCEVVGENGISWSESINTGQRTNLGLDIIKTFSRINGVEMPLWIENAESVTKIQPLDNQIIRLKQVETQKKLNIKIEA